MPIDVGELFDFARLRPFAKVKFGPGCWLWRGAQRNTYGAVTYGAHQRPAHRLIYEWMVGPVPPHLDLDHLCRERLCVRPEHLEPVSRRENLVRGNGWAAHKARQTACVNGHPLSGANVYHWRTSRKCRACHADRERRRRAQRST